MFDLKTVSPLQGLFFFVPGYLGLAPPPADLPQAILFRPFQGLAPCAAQPIPEGAFGNMEPQTLNRGPVRDFVAGNCL